MVADPLSDFLVRLKNAQAVKKESTQVPYSAFLWEVAKLLEAKGYIGKIERRGRRVQRTIEVYFSYNKDGQGRIDGIRRVSKPSRRTYKKAVGLYPYKHGHGAEVISTSKGVMTGDDARKKGVGGEILFQIW